MTMLQENAGITAQTSEFVARWSAPDWASSSQVDNEVVTHAYRPQTLVTVGVEHEQPVTVEAVTCDFIDVVSGIGMQVSREEPEVIVDTLNLSLAQAANLRTALGEILKHVKAEP